MSASEQHFHDPRTVDVEAEATERKRRLRRKRANRALITDAQRSPEQNRRSREVQYLWMQGLRLPFIALSLLAAFVWGNWWVASALFIISIPLPWISVMVANGHGEVRDSRQKNVYKPAVARAEMQLEASRQAQLEARPNPRGSAHLPGIIDHDD